MKLDVEHLQFKCVPSPGSPESRVERDDQRLISGNQSPRVSIRMSGAILAEVGKETEPFLARGLVSDALWALRVFAHNGWEVELVTSHPDLDAVWSWVHRQADGLVSRVRSTQSGEGTDVDLFINSRSDYWAGKGVNWVELMGRLNGNGFLSLGLLPREKIMTHVLEDANFGDYLSDVRADLRCGGDGEANEVLQKIEMYAIAANEAEIGADRLQKALIGGKLLHNVLTLLLSQRFDPLGCLLLAQEQEESP